MCMLLRDGKCTLPFHRVPFYVAGSAMFCACFACCCFTNMFASPTSGHEETKDSGASNCRAIDMDNCFIVQFTRGSQGNVGMTILRDVNSEQWRIAQLTPGGPAEKTGRFELGDVLTDINAETVDPQMSADQVIAMLRGDPNTSVVVTVARPQSDAAWEGALQCATDTMETDEGDWSTLETKHGGILARSRTLKSLPLSQPILGLKWEKIGTEKPTEGRELTDMNLRKALRTQRIFSPEEWSHFGIEDLRLDDFVKPWNLKVFLKPSAPEVEGLNPVTPALASDMEIHELEAVQLQLHQSMKSVQAALTSKQSFRKNKEEVNADENGDGGNPPDKKVAGNGPKGKGKKKKEGDRTEENEEGGAVAVKEVGGNGVKAKGKKKKAEERVEDNEEGDTSAVKEGKKVGKKKTGKGSGGVAGTGK